MLYRKIKGCLGPLLIVIPLLLFTRKSFFLKSGRIFQKFRKRDLFSLNNSISIKFLLSLEFEST